METNISPIEIMKFFDMLNDYEFSEAILNDWADFQFSEIYSWFAKNCSSLEFLEFDSFSFHCFNKDLTIFYVEGKWEIIGRATIYQIQEIMKFMLFISNFEKVSYDNRQRFLRVSSQSQKARRP